MGVTKLVEFLGRDVGELIDELQMRLDRNELVSLAVVVEVEQRSTPLIAFAGRFRTDPYRALVALQRAQRKVHSIVDRIDAGQPGFVETKEG